MPALLESAAPASGGGDADVAACCQTLGGISLHSESGKQAEKQPESEREDRNNFFLASLLLPLSNLAVWLYLNDAAASPLPPPFIYRINRWRPGRDWKWEGGRNGTGSALRDGFDPA